MAFRRENSERERHKATEVAVKLSDAIGEADAITLMGAIQFMAENRREALFRAVESAKAIKP